MNDEGVMKMQRINQLVKLKRFSMLVLAVFFLFGFMTIIAVADDTETEDVEVIASGTIGEDGAPWTLDSNGVVEVGGGTILHDGNFSSGNVIATSPWHEPNCDPINGNRCYGHDVEIIEIIFTEPVVAQEELIGLFTQLSYLTSIVGLENIDTSNVIDMNFMFSSSGSVTSLDLSEWDTSNVVNMRLMFHGMHSLTELDVSNWDTSSVNRMGNMFSGTRNLINLDVSNWDTSSVIAMENMFFGADSLRSLDVSNWDISNVWSMTQMFRGATSLTSLDVSNWDMRSLRNMGFMFSETENLRSLTLGENFKFLPDVTPRTSVHTSIPEITRTAEYTGYWQNVGAGTVEAPSGEHVLTSAELMEQFDSATMADTFVWQRHSGYVVQWGDTLSELAVQFQTTVDELVRLNNIENPDFILTGQILTMPDFRTYQMAMETVPVRFYRLYDDNGGDFIYEYTTAFISGENFAAEMVELANERFGRLYRIDIWLVGNRLYVNLYPPTTQRGGLSSTMTMTGLHSLLLTFTSVPNIDEVAFLNEGQSGGGFGKAAFSNGGLYLVDGPEIEEIRSNHYIFQAYE